MPEPQNNSANVATGQSKVLSIQQVISVIDNRLISLEKYVLEQKNASPTVLPNAVVPRTNAPAVSQEMMVNNNIADFVKQAVDEHMSEFSHRYDLLASELLDLKNIVMKLQSYTMDINKTLIEERIQILSDIPTQSSQGFYMDSLSRPEIATEEEEMATDIDGAVNNDLAASSMDNANNGEGESLSDETSSDVSNILNQLNTTYPEGVGSNKTNKNRR
jgi:hypothetical protein